MKQLSIIVRNEKLDDVKKILSEYNSGGMTVSCVKGCGHARGKRDAEGLSFSTNMTTEINLVAKAKVDSIVHDCDVEAIIDRVCDVARTGEHGDGKIFVYPVEEVIRIRTGERNADAI